MGTEVSMLIQRLKSVLSKEDSAPNIQVIITSASLGDDDDLKKEFVSNLTGVKVEDVSVPVPARTDLMENLSWKDINCDTGINALQNLNVSPKELTESEKDFLLHISKSSDQEI